MPSESRSAPEGARGWSREAPKEPGWYWWRFRTFDAPQAILVGHHRSARILRASKGAGQITYGLDDLGGEWGGRIPSPEALEQARAALVSLRGALEFAAAHQPEDEFRASTLPALDLARKAIESLGGPP